MIAVLFYESATGPDCSDRLFSYVEVCFGVQSSYRGGRLRELGLYLRDQVSFL